MIFRELPLIGAWLIELEPHRDARGMLARVWCLEEFERQGLVTEFVQGNVSINPEPGTLRGLHHQHPPHDEVQPVRGVRGAVYDVMVDVRTELNGSAWCRESVCQCGENWGVVGS